MKVLLFTALATLTLQTTALACSAIWRIDAPATLPADGATNVPLDAKAVLVFPATHLDQFASQGGAVTPEDFADIVVRPVGGEPIDGEVQLIATAPSIGVIFRPRAALMPTTTYEVLDRVREAQPNVFGGSIGELAVRFTFTTGTTSLEAGPSTPPGPVTVSYECCASMCCFGTAFTLTWPGEPDTFYLVGRLASSDMAITTGNTVSGVIAQGASFATPHLFGDGTFQVHAYNVASLGNITPSTVFVEDPCAGPTPSDDSTSEPSPEHAAEPTPDGAETAEVAEPTPGDEAGCGATPTSALAALILAAQSIVRRRYFELKRS